VKNILNFEKDYPGLPAGRQAAKIYKLETNYRSSQEILDVANSVIANNTRQYKKELKTVFSGGKKPLLRPALDQMMEAKFIAEEIEKQLAASVPSKEIAVLFRASHHSQQLELELMRRAINYDYRGGLRFFERAHVKDVLSYLRLLNNPLDTAAWLRVLLHEEGIGPAAAMSAIEQIKQSEAPYASVENVLSVKARNGWQNFLKIHGAMHTAGTAPAALIQAVLESPYKDYLAIEFLDSADRIDDLEQMINFAGQYESLEDFLAETTLAENFNIKNNTRENTGQEKIVLSTVHQAKGLEWQSVFVINMASGAFPNDRALREEHGIEEERRLFYVAITRAKKNLFLTYPLSGGGFGDAMPGPSMFIEEIDPALIEDRSTLSPARSTAFNDSEITYVSEEEEYAPKKISPGSFLRDLDDL
jgi:DNA helicase-2/ATP-dependent DNA helicase PcrA